MPDSATWDGRRPERLTVETRVRAWKTILVAVVAMDVESADTVHTLKFLEAIERHFTGASDELQQLGTLFLVERAHGTPEPLDLGRRGRVVVVLSVHLPVVHLDLGQTGNEQLQLLFIEDGDQIGSDDLMESCRTLVETHT